MTTASPRKRADARRNEQTLLDAAAAVFVESGVDAPVREIATRAGVGMGTIYRHFPTRADLIVAVFRHQVDALVAAGPALLDSAASPFDALASWIDRFVDFLVTKHGLARVFQSDDPGSAALHADFVERLVPVLGTLLDAAVAAGQVDPGTDPFVLMRGVGSICAGFPADQHDAARALVDLLVAGLRRSPA
ncbi:TetR/AcrR family transcriptional regulator [Jatrophihabitans sp. YIM 134969]